MKSEFLEVLKTRRSIYDLSNKINQSFEEIENVVYEALKQAPSAFNIQSAKVVVLFGTHHQKLWDITKEKLRAIVPAVAFSRTEDKIDSFARAAGTVLFFEDDDLTKSLQEKFPLYAASFPVWAEQGNGIAQVCVWSALAEIGVGASLQHYNPLIDEEVAAAWDVPKNYRLIAQMPFGKIESSAEIKEFDAKENRFIVFK